MQRGLVAEQREYAIQWFIQHCSEIHTQLYAPAPVYLGYSGTHWSHTW